MINKQVNVANIEIEQPPCQNIQLPSCMYYMFPLQPSIWVLFLINIIVYKQKLTVTNKLTSATMYSQPALLIGHKHLPNFSITIYSINKKCIML